MKPKTTFTIRQISELTGLPSHTIRYYEKQFPESLAVTRTTGGHRIYRQDSLEKLQTIISLIRDQGMTLRGVRHLLNQNPDFELIKNDTAEAPTQQVQGEVPREEENLIQTLLRICREKTQLEKMLKRYNLKKLAMP